MRYYFCVDYEPAPGFSGAEIEGEAEVFLDRNEDEGFLVEDVFVSCLRARVRQLVRINGTDNPMNDLIMEIVMDHLLNDKSNEILFELERDESLTIRGRKKEAA